MRFGEYIDRRRSELRQTKTELAALIKCSRVTLDEWIGGASFPRSAEHQFNLAAALGCSPQYLQRLWFIEKGHSSAPPLKPRYPGDRVSFVEDLTIEDNKTLLTGQTFTKIWRLQNTGSVNWQDRTLICVDGIGQELASDVRARLLKPTKVMLDIPATKVGQTVDIEAEFTAPMVPTTVLSEWKMADKDGNLCFKEYPALYCLVRVVPG